MPPKDRGGGTHYQQGPGKLPLSTLLNLAMDKESAVEQLNKVVHLALPFSALAGVMEGVRNELGQHINRYYPAVGGILLGYQDPKLTSPTGHLLQDQAFVHLDVSAKFFVFSPQTGGVLRGVVNKRSSGHLGCLVHHTFNVALRAGEMEVTVMEGDEVDLEVIRVGFGFNSLPVIEGKLVRRGERKEYDSEISSPKRREGSNEYDSGISSPDLGTKEKRGREEDEGGEESIRKKRRIDDGLVENNLEHQKSKKKKKGDAAVAEVEISAQKIKIEDGLVDDSQEIRSHKKKKKKHDSKDSDNSFTKSKVIANQAQHKISKEKKSSGESLESFGSNFNDKSLNLDEKTDENDKMGEQEVSAQNIKIEDGFVDNSQESKSHKKKKKKRDSIDLDDKSFTKTDVEENPDEPKSSKKKKSSRESLENSESTKSLNRKEVNYVTEVSEKQEDLKEVLKKRKKKSKEKSVGD